MGAQSRLSAQSTCPNQSVNYITERLPQQCLKIPWSSPTNQATSIDETLTTTDTTQITTESSLTTSEAITATATVITQSYGSRVSLSHTLAPSTHATLSSSSPTTTKSSVASEAPQEKKETQHSVSDAEGESPLDNANFLSFEEWKKQNLAKAGQSADHIGGGRAGVGSDGARRRPGSINNALDSLGEDTELEIDFGGFVNPVPPTRPTPSQEVEGKHDTPLLDKKLDQDLPKAHPRGKDAGKTCKERSNYASFDCAATIMKTNSEGKGATSILVENKDSYMLNECSAKNKFFIVELCDDILIDTVVLANFEFFSSIFRTFRVSVSDRYPVKPDKWRNLGTFEARNSREVQAFLVETPQIWARYLRIEFQTHYGNEYYCPISLLRVHGTTMMEEFNHDLKASREEDEVENEGEAVDGENGISQDVVTAAKLKEEASKASENDASITISTTISSGVLLPPSLSEDSRFKELSRTTAATEIAATTALLPTQVAISFMFNGTPDMICLLEETPQESTMEPSLAAQTSISEALDDMKLGVTQQETTPTTLSDAQSVSVQNNSSSSATASSTPSSSKSSSVIESLPSPTNTGQPSTHNEMRVSLSASSLPRTASSATQPPASNPTTQESFFKSVHKRLQLLESNSTLSLQYIEEQSRILRDAFSKVEKRQLVKASTFFETLNTTVLSEMRDFRSQYDQLWQSTVLELSSQRTQNQQEVLALSTRLRLLADEVVLQRRIAVMQFVLTVVCLGLVLFGRSSSPVAPYLEMPPIVQNAINRSTGNLSRYSPSHDSPNGSPSPTRPSSRYGSLGRVSPRHFRGPSEESRATPSEGRESPDTEHAIPAPTLTRSEYELLSSGESSDLTHAKEDTPTESPEREATGQRKAKSGPSTPRGTREGEQQKLKGQQYLKPG